MVVKEKIKLVGTFTWDFKVISKEFINHGGGPITFIIRNELMQRTILYFAESPASKWPEGNLARDLAGQFDDNNTRYNKKSGTLHITSPTRDFYLSMLDLVGGILEELKKVYFPDEPGMPVVVVASLGGIARDDGLRMNFFEMMEVTNLIPNPRFGLGKITERPEEE